MSPVMMAYLFFLVCLAVATFNTYASWRRAVSKKMGGIVCDHCLKFIDYGFEENIENCVVTNVRRMEFVYCSQECFEKDAQNRRQQAKEQT